MSVTSERNGRSIGTSDLPRDPSCSNRPPIGRDSTISTELVSRIRWQTWSGAAEGRRNSSTTTVLACSSTFGLWIRLEQSVVCSIA